MATIKIQRTSEYNNRMREFKIFVDGQQVGIIANGETKEFATMAGQHTVTAKIDWCSSFDIFIVVVDNETKNLKVSGFKNHNWLMPIGLGIIVLHVILSRTMDFAGTIFLLAPIFLLLVYYLTIGRKRNLTLNEIK